MSSGLSHRLARIRTILFDVTGTLIAPRGGVGERYAELGVSHGLELSAPAVERAFARALAQAPPMAFGAFPPQEREPRERLWWEAVVRKTLAPADRSAEAFPTVFLRLYDYFAGPEAWEVRPGAAYVLGALGERGYSLGVLSNFDSRLPRLLAELDLARHFRAVVTSSELPDAKPAAGAFRAALERIGTTAELAAYVGDSTENDGVGAARAGLLPILVGAPLPPDVTGLRVERLWDLLTVFDTP